MLYKWMLICFIILQWEVHPSLEKKWWGWLWSVSSESMADVHDGDVKNRNTEHILWKGNGWYIFALEKPRTKNLLLFKNTCWERNEQRTKLGTMVPEATLGITSITFLVIFHTLDQRKKLSEFWVLKPNCPFSKSYATCSFPPFSVPNFGTKQAVIRLSFCIYQMKTPAEAFLENGNERNFVYCFFFHLPPTLIWCKHVKVNIASWHDII